MKSKVGPDSSCLPCFQSPDFWEVILGMGTEVPEACRLSHLTHLLPS